MSISIVCTCGKRLKAPDDAMGRKAKCPSCGEQVTIPPPIELVEDRRPFWKDPIIMIGASVPVTILLCFFGYLWYARSVRVFNERIHAARLEGNQLLRNGKFLPAFMKFKAIVDSAGNGDTGISREDVAFALKSVADLKPHVQAVIAKQAEDLHKQEVEEAYQKLEKDREEILAKMTRASDRLKAENSLENITSLKAAIEEFKGIQDRLNERYASLIDEAARYFNTEKREIGSSARDIHKRLKEKGIASDVETILRGAIFLGKNSHYPDDKPKFRDYFFLYPDVREEKGYSHEEAINDLYERKKF